MTSALLVAVAAALAGALPPPPTQVVLTGRGSFGEIHFDHAAHLARRISCTSCHGPGPVHKPELTPAIAHETCRACHAREQRGPTSCRDCHVNVREARMPGAEGGEPAAVTRTIAAAGTSAATPTAPAPATPAASATSTSTSTSSATAAATPASTPASPPASTPPPTSRPPGAASPGAPAIPGPIHGSGGGPTAADDVDAPARAALHAGLASISGSARGGAGLSVGAELEQGRRVVGLEVDWTSRPGAERTLALAEAGLSWPVGRDLRARVMLLGGIDAGSPAYVLPAVGARLALELRGRSALRLLPSTQASVGWVTALGKRFAADGASVREEALVFALSLGWELPAR